MVTILSLAHCMGHGSISSPDTSLSHLTSGTRIPKAWGCIPAAETSNRTQLTGLSLAASCLGICLNQQASVSLPSHEWRTYKDLGCSWGSESLRWVWLEHKSDPTWIFIAVGPCSSLQWIHLTIISTTVTCQFKLLANPLLGVLCGGHELLTYGTSECPWISSL